MGIVHSFGGKDWPGRRLKRGFSRELKAIRRERAMFLRGKRGVFGEREKGAKKGHDNRERAADSERNEMAPLQGEGENSSAPRRLGSDFSGDAEDYLEISPNLFFQDWLGNHGGQAVCYAQGDPAYGPFFHPEPRHDQAGSRQGLAGKKAHGEDYLRAGQLYLLAGEIRAGGEGLGGGFFRVVNRAFNHRGDEAIARKKLEALDDDVFQKRSHGAWGELRSLARFAVGRLDHYHDLGAYGAPSGKGFLPACAQGAELAA